MCSAFHLQEEIKNNSQLNVSQGWDFLRGAFSGESHGAYALQSQAQAMPSSSTPLKTHEHRDGVGAFLGPHYARSPRLQPSVRTPFVLVTNHRIGSESETDCNWRESEKVSQGEQTKAHVCAQDAERGDSYPRNTTAARLVLPLLTLHPRSDFTHSPTAMKNRSMPTMPFPVESTLRAAQGFSKRDGRKQKSEATDRNRSFPSRGK